MSKLAKHGMEPEKSSSCYMQTCWNGAVVLYKFSGLLLELLGFKVRHGKLFSGPFISLEAAGEVPMGNQ